MEALRHLHPLFRGDEDPGTRDNAAGALARIVSAAGAAVPLDQAIPVLLGALPLREDHGEAEAVFGCLASLVTGEHAPAAAPFVPGIVAAFGAAVANDDVPAGVKGSIGATVASLHAAYPSEMRPLVEGLPREQQEALWSAAAARGSGAS
uniref:Arm repeat superfamily protein isoform 1 n=1 Tax=Tetraselmis sp. GSL018 TaxID=582737 RepID=A0A061S2D0_9CHLO